MGLEWGAGGPLSDHPHRGFAHLRYFSGKVSPHDLVGRHVNGADWRRSREVCLRVRTSRSVSPGEEETLWRSLDKEGLARAKAHPETCVQTVHAPLRECASEDLQGLPLRTSLRLPNMMINRA